MVRTWTLLSVAYFTLAGYCPETHRYAYKNGDYCCQEDREADTNEDGCNDQTLKLNSKCCKRDQYTECPNPPCDNSFYIEIDKGKDPITFLRRKGIFVSHEINKKFAMIKQKFPIELNLGYPYPKIDRAVAFSTECDGIKSLSFNFNTILRKIIKEKLLNEETQTNFFHYETPEEHLAHADEDIDLTGHVIIHSADGKISDSHPGDVPLAPHAKPIMPFNHSYSENEDEWTEFLRTTAEETILPTRTIKLPTTISYIISNTTITKPTTSTTISTTNSNTISSTNSTTISSTTPTTNSTKTSINASTRDSTLELSSKPIPTEVPDYRAHYRKITEKDIITSLGPGSPLILDAPTRALYEKLVGKPYSAHGTNDINWETVYDPHPSDEDAFLQGTRIPCNLHRDNQNFHLLTLTKASGNIWLTMQIAFSATITPSAIAADFDIHAILYASDSTEIRQKTTCTLAKAELLDLDTTPLTHLQLEYSCDVKPGDTYYIGDHTAILIKFHTTKGRCDNTRIIQINAKGTFLESPTKSHRSKRQIVAAAAAGITVIGTEIYNLFKTHSNAKQVTKIQQKIDSDSLESHKFQTMFLSDLTDIHLLLNQTTNILQALNTRTCTLFNVEQRLQAELFTTTLADNFVSIFTHQVIYHKLRTSNIRKFSIDLCIKNHFENVNPTSREYASAVCQEFYENFDNAIKIVNVKMETYGPAIKIAVEIPDFSIEEAAIFEIQNVPVPVGKIGTLYTFLQFNALPRNVIHLTNINQTLAADPDSCTMTTNFLFCDKKILFLYDKRSTCAGSIFDTTQFKTCDAELITSIDSCVIRPIKHGLIISNVDPVAINYGDRSTLPVHYIHQTDRTLKPGSHFLSTPRSGSIMCHRTSFYFTRLTFQRPSFHLNISIGTTNSLNLDTDIFDNLNSLMNTQNITKLLSDMHPDSNFPLQSMQNYLDNQHPLFPKIPNLSYSVSAKTKTYTIIGLSIIIIILFLALVIYCSIKIRNYRRDNQPQHAYAPRDQRDERAIIPLNNLV